MKRLLLILLCPLILLAQDTITVVGPKAGSKGGEVKKIIIGPTSATISQGAGTFTFPTGGTPDSSLWAKKWWVTYSINNAPGGSPDTSATGKFISKEQTRTGYYARPDTGTVLLGKTRAAEIYQTKLVLGSGAYRDSTYENAQLALKQTNFGVTDTSSFTTTATRKAIYLPGCRQTWQFWVATRKNGLPVAGDQLAYWTKTDSLIVFRAVGTTSGQMFGYGREK